MNNNKHLPIFAIGPTYLITCLLTTTLGIYFSNKKIILVLEIQNIKLLMSIIGIIFIILGIFIWVYAVIFQKISSEIKSNHLVTTGIYSIVRNPIYLAITLVFTGILLIENNIYLLILPIIYYIYLTVL